MEILIVVAIWTVVVKRGVEDILHTARGGTPHRYAAAKARRQSGAAGRYWGALRDDTFEGMLRRHNERVARRAAGRPTSKVARPRGAATQFFAGLFQDSRRAARRSWDDRWTRLDEKRRERSTRPRPGQDTVPGEVVPNVLDDEPPMYARDGRGWGNCDTCGKRMVLLPYQSTCAWCTYERFGGTSNPDAGRLTADEAKRWTRGPAPRRDEDRAEDGPQDEDQDGPQDESRPESRTNQDEDGTSDQDDAAREDQQRYEEQDEIDRRWGPRDGLRYAVCPECQQEMYLGPDGICSVCEWERRNQRHDKTTTTPEGDAQGSPDTQEGPTTMTATAVDGIGLDPQIKFCEESEQQFVANAQSNDNDLAISRQFADAYRQQVAVTDAAIGGVPQGVAVAAVAAMHAAMDKATAAATDMEQISALYAQAMDKANSAAADMATAAKEFLAYKTIQEQYNAQPDAPDKEFLLTGS